MICVDLQLDIKALNVIMIIDHLVKTYSFHEYYELEENASVIICLVIYLDNDLQFDLVNFKCHHNY